MRILVVDDHADSAALLAKVLKWEGHWVEVVSTCADALTAARHEAFDLMITDLHLEDGSGWDLCLKVRSIRPKLPMIAVSGLADQADKNRSLTIGFCAHLTKPVDLGTLRATITRCVQSVPDAAGLTN
jgi:two-component system CheB/CheR fusion protein